jgi:hypothetical protein
MSRQVVSDADMHSIMHSALAYANRRHALQDLEGPNGVPPQQAAQHAARRTALWSHLYPHHYPPPDLAAVAVTRRLFELTEAVGLGVPEVTVHGDYADLNWDERTMVDGEIADYNISMLWQLRSNPDTGRVEPVPDGARELNINAMVEIPDGADMNCVLTWHYERSGYVIALPEHRFIGERAIAEWQHWRPVIRRTVRAKLVSYYSMLAGAIPSMH